MAPMTVVGLGSALTCEARALLQAADVVAGGKRQLAALEEDGSASAAPHAGTEPPAAERIVLAADVLASVAQIRAAAEAGKRVVVLASGDPLLFGIGATLVRELGRDQV